MSSRLLWLHEPAVLTTVGDYASLALPLVLTTSTILQLTLMLRDVNAADPGTLWALTCYSLRCPPV